jgi:hypothetical protein
MIGDVRMGDSKVNKAPDQVTIVSRVRKKITISGTEMDIELHRIIDSALITKSGTSEKVLNMAMILPQPTCTSNKDGPNQLHYIWA